MIFSRVSSSKLIAQSSKFPLFGVRIFRIMKICPMQQIDSKALAVNVNKTEFVLYHDCFFFRPHQLPYPTCRRFYIFPPDL